MNILFLLPSISHVRFQKRVNALYHLGFQPDILSFERDYYKGKPWSFPYKSLGYLHHGNYLQRLKLALQAIPTTRKHSRKICIIYSFGLDNLLIAWLSKIGFGKKIIIYEIGDVRELFLGKSLTSKLLRSLEKYLLKKTNLLVITSKAYASGYFQEILGVKNLCYQVIENKLDKNNLPIMTNCFSSQKKQGFLRIGYFGVIRCHRSWEILKKLVNKREGRFRLYVRGIFRGLDDIEHEVKNTEFVEYGGPYVSPDDLPEMYDKVDLVWACYPYQGDRTGNWMWARTNRFYEACYFKKPMIAQKGNEDGQIVTKLGIGLSVDLSDIDEAVNSLIKIENKDLNLWEKNLHKVPKKTYIYTDENEMLAEFMKRSLLANKITDK